jgi:CO/xanthine dehydrogenase FAD-binding subunit
MNVRERYLAPSTLTDAARAVAETKATPLAGGTDLLPRWSKGVDRLPEMMVDLKRIAELRGVSRSGEEVSIGACTPLNEITADATIRESAPVLAEAAGRVACPQVRNRATIGGNLCNASPAADTAVPLILLDETLELLSVANDDMTVREVSISEFFRGPGATVLEPGQVLTRIRFKPLPAGAFSAWDKFGTRPSMEIAVASVGLALHIDGGVVTRARVGYGSVAPVPLRGIRAEKSLAGNRLSADVIEKCIVAARGEIAPITDVRASEEYRREMVGIMLKRMLEGAAGTRTS